MAANYWVKLYIETLHDPKMGRLSDHLYRRVIEIILIAGEENKGGNLPPVGDMAWTLHADADALLDDLHELAEVGIVHWTEDGWVVTNYAKRQAASSAAERMRQLRERKQKEQYRNPSYDVVTKRNVEVETESESEEKKITPTRSFREPDAQALLTTLTGWPRIPGNPDAALNALGVVMDLHDRHNSNTIEYLRPFWDAFKAMYPRSTGIFWLTEWAVTGVIPKGGKNATRKEETFIDV